MIPLAGWRWSDPRGWGLRPFEAVGVDPRAVGELHVVSVEAGAVRGNHLHPAVTEWLLVFGAPVTLAWQAPGQPVERLEVDGSDPVVAEIPPGVAHAIRGLGPGTAFLVSWADGVPETVRTEAPLL